MRECVKVIFIAVTLLYRKHTLHSFCGVSWWGWI